MRISDTGYWLTGPGDRPDYYFDAGVAASLLRFFSANRAASVLDLGCGNGDYVRGLLAVGMAASGVDGNPRTPTIAGSACQVHDLTQPLPADMVADWTLSLEVGEHIPARWEFAYWANLHRSNRAGLILSWAVRGQAGTGHVNCRDNPEVTGMAELLGYRFDSLATAALRRAARKAWFRHTILVFRR
jgi:SAM-dependent methyltransferase